jgi:hypothetical protein
MRRRCKSSRGSCSSSKVCGVDIHLFCFLTRSLAVRRAVAKRFNEIRCRYVACVAVSHKISEVPLPAASSGFKKSPLLPLVFPALLVHPPRLCFPKAAKPGACLLQLGPSRLQPIASDFT